MTDAGPQTSLAAAGTAPRAGDVVPDASPNSARPVPFSSASFPSSSPKNAPNPPPPAPEEGKHAIRGERAWMGELLRIGAQNVRLSRHPRGRTPGRTRGARGAGARPSPGARSAHACGRPGRRGAVARISSPQITPPKAAAAGSPRTSPGAAGGRPLPAGTRSLAAPGWSRIPPPAAPRGPGRATPRPRHSAEPAQPSPCPYLSRLRRDLAPAPGKGDEGSAVERRSEYPAWSNRTRTPERGTGSGRPGEDRRGRATENPQAGRPPPRRDRPATASCLGSASQLLPEEKPEPPLQLRRG